MKKNKQEQVQIWKKKFDQNKIWFGLNKDMESDISKKSKLQLANLMKSKNSTNK